jgi:hypothetical protein
VLRLEERLHHPGALLKLPEQGPRGKPHREAPALANSIAVRREAEESLRIARADDGSRTFESL